MTTEDIARAFRQLAGNIETELLGIRPAVELALTCLLAEGHLLIEDRPGVGKTSLAKILARSIGGSVKRIQFTPDLLPMDITGGMVMEPETRALHFRPGPIFANIVVADEINRASAKTQSALLEVMEEREVTVDGYPEPLPAGPFVVIATQNPIDAEGTYPLPEAQLDRFLMRISIGYPGFDDELRMLAGRTGRAHRDIVELAQVEGMIKEVAGSIQVEAEVEKYALRIVRRTRELTEERSAKPARAAELLLGVSPRGALALIRAAKAWAASRGRGYVMPEDIKELAIPVLSHRLVLSPQARYSGRTAEQVLHDVLHDVQPPV